MQFWLKKTNGKLKVHKAMKERTKLRKLKMPKCSSRLSRKLKSIKLKGIWQPPRKERPRRNDAPKFNRKRRLKTRSNNPSKGWERRTSFKVIVQTATMKVVPKVKRKRRLKRKKNPRQFKRKRLAHRANNQRMIPLRPHRPRSLKRLWVKNRWNIQMMTIQS